MTVRATGVVNVGDEAPDFTLRSLDGEEVGLSEYRGKKLVLFMWGSW
jgi:peroxiredoxin